MGVIHPRYPFQQPRKEPASQYFKCPPKTIGNLICNRRRLKLVVQAPTRSTAQARRPSQVLQAPQVQHCHCCHRNTSVRPYLLEDDDPIMVATVHNGHRVAFGKAVRLHSLQKWSYYPDLAAEYPYRPEIAAQTAMLACKSNTMTAR
jgi:hypothetical protein